MPGVPWRLLTAFRGRSRVLHLTWLAFFLTVVVWFGFAPFAPAIGSELGLSGAQLTTLALCNVALTVPARAVVGAVLDRHGPRRVFGGILIFSAIPSLVFASASSFPVLVGSRLALSVVGAGFVVGIRMVAEWFPRDELGFAEGVYAGWGNSGSAAAALFLPVLGGFLGGWRVALATIGLLAGAYGLYYLRAVEDTPEGSSYDRPVRHGALEVTGRGAVVGLVGLTVPLAGVVALVAWRIERSGVLPSWGLVAVLVAVGIVLTRQVGRVLAVNASAWNGPRDPADRYPFRAVPILSLAYAVTFGSEIALVSMLPTFLARGWDLGPVAAGAAASIFAATNLAARPAGGFLSDRRGSRRRTLLALLAVITGAYGGLAVVADAAPLGVTLLLVALCSASVQAGSGAVYAIVPLVRRRATGQIAGVVGAYGTVGGVVFLTLLVFVPPSALFALIGASAVLALVASVWLPELRGDEGTCNTVVTETLRVSNSLETTVRQHRS